MSPTRLGYGELLMRFGYVVSFLGFVLPLGVAVGRGGPDFSPGGAGGSAGGAEAQASAAPEGRGPRGSAGNPAMAGRAGGGGDCARRPAQLLHAVLAACQTHEANTTTSVQDCSSTCATAVGRSVPTPTSRTACSAARSTAGFAVAGDPRSMLPFGGGAVDGRVPLAVR